VDPKAGGKEKNSASAVNLTPAIKPSATQKATYSPPVLHGIHLKAHTRTKNLSLCMP
jgi:hypothetical protein